MIKDILKNSGKYDIVGEATNGQEAVDRFKELNPDIVTMDIVMPIKDGIEVTREILHHNPKARVVMCSALGQEAKVAESLKHGARDFVIKPFEADTVKSAIDKALAA